MRIPRPSNTVRRAVCAFALAVLTMAGPSFAARPAEVVGHSVKGRPILVYRVGDPAAVRNVLVVGCIHGDECAAFPVIDRLRKSAPIPGVQLWIVPSVNPDGRRTGTRGNAHGVDLNRNFPFRWKRIPRSSRYYSGPRPLSEPESVAIRALILRVRPDLSIWYHQPETNVRDPEGSPEARRYARLVGLPFARLAAPPGTVAEWTERKLPGREAFVVELAPGPLPSGLTSRHAAAVRVLASD